MPQLDFNLIFINFLSIIVFFIIFYLFNYFFIMKKIFSVFMVRKFVQSRILNRLNALSVVKKTNDGVIGEIQTELVKLVKKIN